MVISPIQIENQKKKCFFFLFSSKSMSPPWNAQSPNSYFSTMSVFVLCLCRSAYTLHVPSLRLLIFYPFSLLVLVWCRCIEWVTGCRRFWNSSFIDFSTIYFKYFPECGQFVQSERWRFGLAQFGDECVESGLRFDPAQPYRRQCPGREIASALAATPRPGFHSTSGRHSFH